MKPYTTKQYEKVLEDDPKFTKEFWRGFSYALLAGMGIVILLLAAALAAYYGQKYNF